MNVMYLCDNNYIDIAGVSILSLMKNHISCEKIHIYLVADKVEEENLRKLDTMIRDYGNEFHVIAMPKISEMLGIKIETHWWVENVFSRVFLDIVFKDYPEVTRLLYIDCDTLIVGNLDDLWELDLGDYVAAGICEAMGKYHKKAIGLDEDDEYFNAGVFLIDLNKWKKEKLDQASFDFIHSQNGKLEYADESVLNHVLRKQILKISPKYNMTSLSIYLTEKELRIFRKASFYTERERQEAIEDPRIIHFTSTFMDKRPWVEGSKHIYAEKWRECKAETPWCNTPLKKDRNSLIKKIGNKCINLLPKYLKLYIAGFLHAYLKPLKYL